MTYVFEALQLEPFQEFELQAGEAGLQREVTNVTILDYETDARDYSAFRPGDFILSSLYFAKNDESLILDAFRALITRGISGFAIKTVYYFTISDKLRRMADAAGVPVFTFHTTSMEDIIIAVSDLIKEKDRQLVHSGLLDQLLRPRLSESAVSALSHQLDDQMGPWCMAAYATFRQQSPYPGFPSRRTILSAAMDERDFHYALFVYRDGALLLLTCHQPLEERICQPLLLAKLERLRMPLSGCQVGLGLPGATHRRLDACVSQSLQANRLCRLWNKDILRYSQLGLSLYLLPLLEAPGCLEDCRRRMALLQGYDAAHEAALAATLEAFVRCRGDVNRTAAALYQHPNTVRYRMKKIRQLWEDPEDFDQLAFLCVQLCRLEEDLRAGGF